MGAGYTTETWQPMHRKEFPSFRNNLATGTTFIYVEKHWPFVPYKRRVTNFKGVIKERVHLNMGDDVVGEVAILTMTIMSISTSVLFHMRMILHQEWYTTYI